MTDQEIRGKVKNLTGRAKQAAGALLGNAELENEGAAQRLDGAVEEKLGKARRKVGEALQGVAKKLKD